LKLIKVITISGIISLSISAYANDDITPYVVGGVDSKALELPWQVYIEIEKNGATYVCGGTLITDTWVVTAAHCLNGLDSRDKFEPVNTNQVAVYSGGIDRSLNGDLSKNIVTKLITHLGYSQSTNTHDIALLELSLPVASPAQAIKLMDNELQRRADLEFDNAAVDNLIVSGWGRISTDGKQSTNILQKTAVSGVSDSRCALSWGNFVLESNFICANAFERGSCNGDSGGPLIWQNKLAQSNDDMGYRIAGVVSFGNAKQCAYNLSPDVYTEVSAHKTWIIGEINKTGAYVEPNPTFTQDIFLIEEYPQPLKSSGGGMSYSFVILLAGLLLHRRKH
jgi:secreted trypsin-like serine protease